MIQQNNFWQICNFFYYAKRRCIKFSSCSTWSSESLWGNAQDASFSALQKFWRMLKIQILLCVSVGLYVRECFHCLDSVRTSSLNMLFSVLIKSEKCFSRLISWEHHFRTSPLELKWFGCLRNFFICGKSCGNVAKAWGLKRKESWRQMQNLKWLSKPQTNCLKLI